MALYGRAGPRLLSLIRRHLVLAERHLRFEHSVLPVSGEDRAEHAALVAAAEGRDVEAAVAILRNHVSDAGEPIARAIEARQERA